MLVSLGTNFFFSHTLRHTFLSWILSQLCASRFSPDKGSQEPSANRQATSTCIPSQNPYRSTVQLSVAQSTNPACHPPRSISFMQRELTETSKRDSLSATPRSPQPTAQDGFHRPRLDGRRDHHAPALGSPSGRSPRSVQPEADAAGAGGAVNARQLDEKLRRLSGHDRARRPAPAVAGQRISEYENALTPTAPKQPPGFNLVKRPGSPSEGTQLTDFPNGPFAHTVERRPSPSLIFVLPG